MEINDVFLSHSGRGLLGGAGPVPEVAAMWDLQAFPPSFRVPTRKIGASRVKLIGIRSDMSLGRIMNYLLSLATRPP